MKKITKKPGIKKKIKLQGCHMVWKSGKVRKSKKKANVRKSEAKIGVFEKKSGIFFLNIRYRQFKFT